MPAESAPIPLSQVCAAWPPHEPSEAQLKAFLILWLRDEGKNPEHHPWANPWLAVYGTLAPGEENAHWLAPLKGEWREAHLPGKVKRTGSYPHFYPGKGWEKGAVLHCASLHSVYPALDRFEGPEYRRLLWPVLTEEWGWKIANVYAAWDSPLFSSDSVP